jgi:hypothetical protein
MDYLDGLVSIPEDDDDDIEIPVKLVGEILHETEKAILFAINGSPIRGGTWFPKSQIYKVVKNPPQFNGTETREELMNWIPKDEIHISKWIADKKGLKNDAN